MLLTTELLEKLMTFYYAIDQVNNKNPNTKIGLLVLDSCAFVKQQVQQFFAAGSNFKLLSKLVAILNLFDPNNAVSTEVFSIRDDSNLFFYNFHYAKFKQPNDFVFSDKFESSLVDVQAFKIRALVDVLSRNRWTTVNLVYSNEFDKNYFTIEANKNNICVDRILKVTMQDISNSVFKKTWDAFLNSTNTNILVPITSVEVSENLLKHSDIALDQYIWLGLKSLKTAAKNSLKNYQKTPKTMIIAKRWSSDNNNTLHYHEMELDQLSPYFELNSSKILEHKQLAKLVEQYWQAKFNCQPKIIHNNRNCFKGNYALQTFLNIKETKHLVDFAKGKC